MQALRQELEQERRSQTHHGDGVHTSTRAETVITGTEKVHIQLYTIQPGSTMLVFSMASLVNNRDDIFPSLSGLPDILSL